MPADRPKAPRAARGSGGAADAGQTAGRDRPRPRRFRPAFTSRAAILALVVCAIALSMAYPLREYIAQRSEIAQLREERTRLERDVAELEERDQELADPDHIEREARTRLHYRYPGEQAYIVLDGDSAEEVGSDEDETERQPWFTQLWRSIQEADESDPGNGDLPEAQPPPRDSS